MSREQSDSKQYSKFIEGKKERERKFMVIYVRYMKKTT